MVIIDPYFALEDDIDGIAMIKSIERAGRTCYRSEKNIRQESAHDFIKKIISSGHESVIEHEKITVRIICDRGVSHEIVRHRIASYSQESTRYCNYANNKFGKELTFIKPFFWEKDTEAYKIWLETMRVCEQNYMALIELGAAPQQARSILPNSLKTEIVITMNLREWRHFFKLRTSKNAHPQMRQISLPLLERFKELIPIVFDDIVAEPL